MILDEDRVPEELLISMSDTDVQRDPLPLGIARDQMAKDLSGNSPEKEAALRKCALLDVAIYGTRAMLLMEAGQGRRYGNRGNPDWIKAGGNRVHKAPAPAPAAVEAEAEVEPHTTWAGANPFAGLVR